MDEYAALHRILERALNLDAIETEYHNFDAFLGFLDCLYQRPDAVIWLRKKFQFFSPAFGDCSTQEPGGMIICIVRLPLGR
jgi:hypothetical protein